jgi:hypothetical protein
MVTMQKMKMKELKKMKIKMKRINVDKDEKMNVKIELLKKCTLLCREARFQVKMLKNTLCSQHFWKLSC